LEVNPIISNFNITNSSYKLSDQQKSSYHIMVKLETYNIQKVWIDFAINKKKIKKHNKTKYNFKLLTLCDESTLNLNGII
jgi:hypothetical protein